MPSVPKFPLSTSIALPSSYTIPLIGYGVYQIPSASCPALVSHALSLGYRHIDSARAYRNEKGCAEGIQRLLSDGLKREEVFFTSKLPPKNLGYESARRSVEETLEETGLGYLDLCLIHAPYGGKRARLGAWRGLCEMWKVFALFRFVLKGSRIPFFLSFSPFLFVAPFVFLVLMPREKNDLYFSCSICCSSSLPRDNLPYRVSLLIPELVPFRILLIPFHPLSRKAKSAP